MKKWLEIILGVVVLAWVFVSGLSYIHYNPENVDTIFWMLMLIQ